ncbi:hypothetical protein D3C73_1404480 [compost metagenome]
MLCGIADNGDKEGTDKQLAETEAFGQALERSYQPFTDERHHYGGEHQIQDRLAFGPGRRMLVRKLLLAVCGDVVQIFFMRDHGEGQPRYVRHDQDACHYETERRGLALRDGVGIQEHGWHEQGDDANNHQ